MRYGKIVALSLCLPLLAAGRCSPKLDANVTVETPDISKAASELSEGIKGFDPIGLQNLINQNDDLKQQIDLLKTQLAGLGSVGGVVEVSPTSRVCFEISNYVGSFRVDGWVNSEANWFLKNKVISMKPAQLDMTFDVVKKRSQQLSRATGGIATINPAPSESDALYKGAVEESFARYVARPGGVPSADISGCNAVDRRLRWSERDHTIFMRVTPLEADANGKWMLEYITYILRDTGDGNAVKERISTGRVDSDLFPDVSLGKSISEEAATFYVTISDMQAN